MKLETLNRPSFEEKPQEKCGISLVISKVGEPVSVLGPLMQHKLQHRGADAAGGVVRNLNGDFVLKTGEGKVFDVFPQPFEPQLLGDRSFWHNRYGTSEKNGVKDDLSGAQPIMAEWEDEVLYMGYNGNLGPRERKIIRSRIPNELRKEHSYDTTDIGDAIVSAPGNTHEEQVKNAMQGVDLAYSLVMMWGDGSMGGLRCPSGTWPLMLGETETEYILSSETRVDQVFDKKVNWKEIKPGEYVELTPDSVEIKQLFEPAPERVCALHAMYGARADSLMTEEGVTYGDFRKRLGFELGKEHPVPNADLIIGIPYSGLDIARGYAEAMGMEATEGAITLNQEDRTYIAKTPEESATILSGKFGIPTPEVFKDKVVVANEDSLIKGLTMGGDPERGVQGIVSMVRKAGAKEFHLRVIMDKFRKGCVSGYVVREDKLVAMVLQPDGTYLELTEEEIAEKINADSVSFLSVNSAKKVFKELIGREDMACFRCVGGTDPIAEHELGIVMQESVPNSLVLV